VGEIKSAYEIAMEKLKEIGEVTEEERLRWKFIPLGEILAQRYLNSDASITAELNAYSSQQQPFVNKGVQDVLLGNLSLPRNESTKKRNKRVMDGLREIKSDKTALENIFSHLRQILDHYSEFGEEQRNQAYDQLKMQFENQVRQALKQQRGIAPDADTDLGVERLPQFQEEWRKTQAQMEVQCLSHIDEIKKRITRLD